MVGQEAFRNAERPTPALHVAHDRQTNGCRGNLAIMGQEHARNAERPTPAPNYLLSRVEQGTDGIERVPASRPGNAEQSEPALNYLAARPIECPIEVSGGLPMGHTADFSTLAWCGQGRDEIEKGHFRATPMPEVPK
jgi:hypothetical protein